MRQRGRKQGEKGFALLFIFALAGIAALMLYNELPRAVFESQRAKEELLVMRGQEYQRAIQLYFRKYRKYPQTIEELEKTSGIRYLRQRYRDPMTGKDEWRMVHINAAGQFTDSKVIKPPTAQQALGSGTATGTATDATKEDPNDPATKKRASDVGAADIGGQNGGQNAIASIADPNAPPPAPGAAPMSPMGAGQQLSGRNFTATPGIVPGNNSYPQQPYSGGVGANISSGGVGASAPALPNYGNNGIIVPAGGMNGSQQQNVNGQRPLTPEQLNPALGIIQGLLTTPRQPPPGVLSSNTNTTAGTGSTFGTGGAITSPSGTFNTTTGSGLNGQNTGGIAGVASKYVGRGIKLINERERIEEWEFIYDNAKDRGGRPGANTQSQQPGQIPGQIPGQNPQQGGFGNQTNGQQGGLGGGGQNNNRPPNMGGQGGFNRPR